jgi:asparagine N-glycosylation enzyme membrane subunit Stt3
LRKSPPAIVVSISILLAFGLRVFPADHAVFAAHGISFEEPDAWFHMRNIHNLPAHFPRHSGFDPYGIYPRGESAV